MRQLRILLAMPDAMKARWGVEVTPAAVLRAALTKGIATLQSELAVPDKPKGKR